MYVSYFIEVIVDKTFKHTKSFYKIGKKNVISAWTYEFFLLTK